MTSAAGVQPSLATLVDGQESLDWTEAVALVSELCRSVLARDPAAIHYPDAASVSVDATGTMLVTGDSKARDVTYAAQLLQELLGTSPTPAPLRLFAQRALESYTYGSVAEFARALEYYERPGRAEVIQKAIQKVVTGATRAAEPQTESPRTTVPAGARPAQRRSRKRFAVVVGVAVTTATIASFMTFRLTDVRTPSLAPPMTLAANQAVNAITAASDRIRTRLGLAPVTPLPQPVAADVSTQQPRSATPRPRNVRRGSPAGSTPDRTLAAQGAAAVQATEFAAAPISETTTSSDTPSDEQVYSRDSADVAPPRLLDAGTLPPAAFNAAPTDAVELVVDLDGQVRQVKLLTGTRRMSDVMLLSAAKAWRFAPATRNGYPVRYRLVLQWSTVTRQ